MIWKLFGKLSYSFTGISCQPIEDFMHEIKSLKDKVEFLETLNQNAKMKMFDFETDPAFMKIDAKFAKLQSDNEKCLANSEVLTKNFFAIIEKVDIVERALKLKENENCAIQDVVNRKCLLENENLLRLKRESSFIDIECEKFEENFQSCNVKKMTISHPEVSVRKVVAGHRMQEIDGNAIEYLKAFNEQIIFLPLNFPQSFPNLKTLSFIECGLISINTKALSGFKKLQTLSLPRNAIKDISAEGFIDLDALTILDLSHNKIEKIFDETLKNLLELSVIKLNDNQITELTANVFANQGKLKFLLLQNNKLSSVSSILLEPLKKLEFVDFSDNNCVNLSASKETPITIKNLKNYFSENCEVLEI